MLIYTHSQGKQQRASKMNTEKKKELIAKIMEVLKVKALAINDLYFDKGDTFFALCFKSDKELLRIAGLCKV